MMLQRCLVMVGLTGLGCAGLGRPFARPPTFPAGSPLFIQNSTGLYDGEGQFLAALGGRSVGGDLLRIDGTLDVFFLLSDPSETVRVARRQGDTFVVTTLFEDTEVEESLGSVAIVRPAGGRGPARVIDADGTVLQEGIAPRRGAAIWRPEYWWNTEVRPLPYCLARPDGLADEDRCGWIAPNGQWLAEGPVYRWVTGFETGFAAGREGHRTRWFLPSGTALPDVSGGAYSMTPSSDGLQIIFGSDLIVHGPQNTQRQVSTLQVVDRDGVTRGDVDSRVLTETPHRGCTDPSECDYRFHEERAAVWLAYDLDFQQAYLGPDGAFAIGPVPCEADVLSGPFHEGRAFFCEGEEYWMIDATGKHLAGPWPAWDPGLDRHMDHYPTGLFFADGLAAVPVDGGWAYIDRSGAVVLPGPYTVALPFRQGIATVFVGDDVRHLDKRGRWVMEPPDE